MQKGNIAYFHRKDAEAQRNYFFLAACLREAASAKAGERSPNKKTFLREKRPIW
jgi:hypothetical protein